MTNNDVCPAKYAIFLDNIFRRWIHNPKKILADLVKEGMVVLDIGCGPGVFSVEMAKMVGRSGRVIAADLQEDMLEKLKRKTTGKEIQNIITLHKCEQNRIGVSEKADFVLAFYVVHEVPDKKGFFTELRSILKPSGKALFIEPKFHVSKTNFEKSVSIAEESGFRQMGGRQVFNSRAVILQSL
ncbi:MAG: class I SAM-dependent methyltransferase [Sedimentisphaerales bacterium]|jgi:FkbM family methyltransferase